VTDELPASAWLIGQSGDVSCSVGDGVVTCTRDSDLAPGEEFTISLTTNVDRTGTVLNTATVTVSPDQADVDLSNNTDEATSSAGELPFTGADMQALLFVALFMLLAGAVVVVTSNEERVGR
jgi:hypothetical protein